MRIRHASRLVPRVLAGCLFITMSAVGALTMLRPLLHNTWGWPYRDLAPPLQGMQISPEQPILTLKAMWDGRFQRAAESWVTNNLPQRAALVRSFNEAVWRAFSTSYMANRTLEVGGDGMLFGQSYIMAYCIAQPIDPAALRTFAKRMRLVQDWFAGRGQAFAYMLAPTKPYFVQHLLPAAFPCDAKRHDQIYPQVVTTLRAAGVNVVDGRAALVDSRVPVLFPRNGTHWNWLGAAVATEALVRELRRQGLSGLPDLNYSVTVLPDEVGSDRELSDLLNLWRQPPGQPSVAVQAIPAGADAPNKLTLVAVNDSFFNFNAHLLSAGQIFGTVEVNGYLTVDQRRMINGAEQRLSIDSDAVLERILSADAVVLEVVESIGGINVSFVLRFLEMIENEARRPR